MALEIKSNTGQIKVFQQPGRIKNELPLADFYRQRYICVFGEAASSKGCQAL